MCCGCLRPERARVVDDVELARAEEAIELRPPEGDHAGGEEEVVEARAAVLCER